jgi:hypothetical protein
MTVITIAATIATTIATTYHNQDVLHCLALIKNHCYINVKIPVLLAISHRSCLDHSLENGFTAWSWGSVSLCFWGLGRARNGEWQWAAVHSDGFKGKSTGNWLLLARYRTKACRCSHPILGNEIPKSQWQWPVGLTNSELTSEVSSGWGNKFLLKTHVGSSA